jgi:thiamine-monophosphate kinase
MKVGELGEFGLIERIAGRVGAARAPVVEGIGVDASILAPTPGYEIVTTTDMLIEGVHFLLEKTPARDLGFKSLAVNVSDVAAMGAVPIQAFVSIGLPPETLVEDVDLFYDGILEAAAGQTQISGGDTVSSPGGWAISVTVIGEVRSGAALRRDAAQIGDSVCVCGPLGDSAAGLALMLGKAEIDDQGTIDYLLEAHNRPRPQVKMGRLLSESGVSRCAVDVSDGFMQDLGHICKASGVGARIELNGLPVSTHLIQTAEKSGVDPFMWPLTGGEDYSIIFTVDPGKIDSLEELSSRQDLKISMVGKIVEGGTIDLFHEGKPYRRPDGGGFDHFVKKQD